MLSSGWVALLISALCPSLQHWPLAASSHNDIRVTSSSGFASCPLRTPAEGGQRGLRLIPGPATTARVCSILIGQTWVLYPHLVSQWVGSGTRWTKHQKWGTGGLTCYGAGHGRWQWAIDYRCLLESLAQTHARMPSKWSSNLCWSIISHYNVLSAEKAVLTSAILSQGTGQPAKNYRHPFSLLNERFPWSLLFLLCCRFISLLSCLSFWALCRLSGTSLRE